MAFLRSGVLIKLLEDMRADDKDSEDDRKTVMLQIRSIIPVLEEDDLWPNRGFNLKVSDSSQALFVALPQEQNEMVLGNRLKLGQFIFVDRLEAAHPVPLLRGITPVPGRRSCVGSPEDIIPSDFDDPVKFHEDSDDSESVVEKGVISEIKLIRRLSDPETLFRKRDSSANKGRSSSSSKARPSDRRIVTAGFCNGNRKGFDLDKRMVDVKPDLQHRRRNPSGAESDSDSTVSSASSTRQSKRKSWTESELFGVKEMFDSSVIKHEIKPRPRCRSANASPIRHSRYDSSDDNSSFRRRHREVGSGKKTVRSSAINKNNIPLPKGNSEQTLCSPLHERKVAEARISWDSLPSSLTKLGKEVVRHKEAAVIAAVEALQEACAAERLLNCLSTYSQFHLDERDDLHPHVVKFFDLQDDLSHTRLIMQSLTNISPLRTRESDVGSSSSIRGVLNLAADRKKNAAFWIKSAIAFDLSPCSAYNADAASAHKKPTGGNYSATPKGSYAAKAQRKNGEISLVLAADKDEPPEWVKGYTLCAAAELATSLQDECRNLFLGYLEKYVDEVESKTNSMESDSQRPGMMYAVKRVSDWLDVFVGRESNCNPHMLEDSETQACGRLRSKIYGILLKNVERTAMALDG